METESCSRAAILIGMPPSTQPLEINEHLLPPAQKTPAGPIVGIVIIVALLILGALYFWGAHLNATNPEDNLPLILGNDSGPVQ